ncbi:MAG TPA: YceD family protein [Saprospiraceae bacterium]|nr:YceD family protein [Saprospiraceae bacterium]
MDALAPFRIPMSALKADSASYDWDLGEAFFALFDEAHQPPKGQFHVELELERTGLLVTLNFSVKGMLHTTCDRCDTGIELPIEHEYQLVVKFGDPAESTDEVIFVEPEAAEWNVGKSIYDFILVSIPISHRIPNCESMENPPCDMSIVRFLNQTEMENKTPDVPNALWEQVRKAIDN